MIDTLPISARGTLGPDPILFLLGQSRSIGGGGEVCGGKEGGAAGAGEELGQ